MGPEFKVKRSSTKTVVQCSDVSSFPDDSSRV